MFSLRPAFRSDKQPRLAPTQILDRLDSLIDDLLNDADLSSSSLASILVAARESVRVQLHPLQSEPAQAITAVAAEEGADLIVVGSRAGNGNRRLTDVPKAVMDCAECAVLVV